MSLINLIPLQWQLNIYWQPFFGSKTLVYSANFGDNRKSVSVLQFECLQWKYLQQCTPAWFRINKDKNRFGETSLRPRSRRHCLPVVTIVALMAMKGMNKKNVDFTCYFIALYRTANNFIGLFNVFILVRKQWTFGGGLKLINATVTTTRHLLFAERICFFGRFLWQLYGSPIWKRNFVYKPFEVDLSEYFFNMEKIEYRTVIRFFVLKDLKAKEIYEQLLEVYKESSPSKRTVEFWSTRRTTKNRNHTRNHWASS